MDMGAHWKQKELKRMMALTADHTNAEIADILNREFGTGRTCESVISAIGRMRRRTGERKHMGRRE